MDRQATASVLAPSRPVLIGRLGLLLLAVLAVVGAFVMTRESSRVRKGGAAAAGGEGSVPARAFTCPMHPEVAAADPGECPICRMPLEMPEASQSGASPAVTEPAKRRVFTKDARGAASVAIDGAIEAVLYKDDLIGVVPGDPALFFRATAPTVGIPVRMLADPAASWDRSTTKVRFRVAAPAVAPAAGAVGWVTLAARRRELLVVPAGAVLHATDGAYVLAAATDGGSFARRKIETGKTLYGVTAVVAGLREGDKVAVGDGFFWDAEARLARAAAPAPAGLP